MSKSTKLGLPRAKENTYLLYNLLTSGKKVVMVDRPLRYTENIVPDNPFEPTRKTTNVLYVYTNPQFNRMLAKLEDGRTVDFELGFLDMCWNSFEEWKSPAMILEEKITETIEMKKQMRATIEDYSIEELELIAKLLRKENQ